MGFVKKAVKAATGGLLGGNLLGGGDDPSIPEAPQGLSAEEIRAEEQAKLREQSLANLQEQEAKRSSLRAQLVAGEDEDDEQITRKRLFGE